MRANAYVAPLTDILADPSFFPVQVDLGADRITFVQITRDRLASAPFLDGRTAFADGVALEVVLSEALTAQWPRTDAPARFIFHVAFCGSTFLATLLDLPGACFAQREPNVLVNLANTAASEPPALIGATLQLTQALLGRPWLPGEVNLCKPSNWANNLIPLLTASPERVRPLFLATSRGECLYALMRGGSDRIAYVVRATDHLLKQDSLGASLWQRAFAGTEDRIEIAARIALVGLDAQLRLFEAAMLRGGWGAEHMLTLTQIEEDPVEACMVASEALDLGVQSDELLDAVETRAGRNAKSPDHTFSPEGRQAENRQVEDTYGPLIERVLEWAGLIGLREDSDLIRTATTRHGD